ncbi:hypothetical protein QJS66_16305 [Kocuria rhizophila]|nr:hypothetical protein QJS66_16305 [Kocuria rhizophila]
MIAVTGLGRSSRSPSCCGREPGAFSGRVHLLGTPTEEGEGGKEIMARDGALEGIDAAAMVHPYMTDLVDQVLARRRQCEVTFHGQGLHASSHPFMGRDALDGAVLAYQGLGLLRQRPSHGPDTRRAAGRWGAAQRRHQSATLRLYVRSQRPVQCAVATGGRGDGRGRADGRRGREHRVDTSGHAARAQQRPAVRPLGPRAAAAWAGPLTPPARCSGAGRPPRTSATSATSPRNPPAHRACHGGHGVALPRVRGGGGLPARGAGWSRRRVQDLATMALDYLTGRRAGRRRRGGLATADGRGSGIYRLLRLNHPAKPFHPDHVGARMNATATKHSLGDRFLAGWSGWATNCPSPLRCSPSSS